MHKSIARFALTGLLGAVAGAAAAQALPATQPKFLQVIREQVKMGRAAEHSRFEAGWPAAFEKHKSAMPYLALVSMTGSRETWYVTPFESHAAMGEAMKKEEADPVLTAELERLSRGDAEFLSDWRSLQAAARPDLSYGQFPDLAKVRFYEITIFRVRPGHDAGFAGVARAYAEAAAKAAPKAAWRTYEVMAGAPGGTYLVFGSLESFGEFDRLIAEGEAMFKSFSAIDGAAMQKFSADGLISAETNRFRLDPVQSYVPKETREKDPAFWMPPPPKKPAKP
jgi:hypothetical protein